MISDKKPHIIALNPTIDDSHVDIEDYSIVRKDRNLSGGGVALYIHKSLNFKIKVYVLLKKSLPSKIELIDHSSITEGHLNGSGLHLNQRGDGAMAFNLMKHIRETEK